MISPDRFRRAVFRLHGGWNA